ncbi:hypothetical protein [Escherichia coli]|uniref:hypothetical protein n=1 Tax=Escherichia coli TaxID=562 RepID=UPI000DDAC82A|nr:hypothetical protein [Escherichia coli]MDZ8265885.1 hypothetical protein [Escherichia coli]
MNTFKNKNTEIFYVVSLHIYAELFNSKDKTTSNMIITHVMDHEFVCRLIDLAMRNAEKHLLKKAWCHERCNSDPHPTPEIRSRG